MSACPNCDSDNWLSHMVDLSRHYCLDCDHEWFDLPASGKPPGRDTADPLRLARP